MDSREFQIAVSDTIFNSQKGGQPITIKLKTNHTFNIDSIIYCNSCEEFHICIGSSVPKKI